MIILQHFGTFHLHVFESPKSPGRDLKSLGENVGIRKYVEELVHGQKETLVVLLL